MGFWLVIKSASNRWSMTPSKPSINILKLSKKLSYLFMKTCLHSKFLLISSGNHGLQVALLQFHILGAAIAEAFQVRNWKFSQVLTNYDNFPTRPLNQGLLERFLILLRLFLHRLLCSFSHHKQRCTRVVPLPFNLHQGDGD